MPSLQLLQLTEHGRGLLSSRRKALLLATGIVVAGGTAAAYMHSRNSCTRQNTFGHSDGAKDYKEQSDELIVKENKVKKGRQKRGNLRSLQVLAAILLSRMGRTGAINILSLVAIAVFRTALSNRLAKVQGFLFRAAFLRRVPVFIRLIIENIFLCFLLSLLSSTSKYITGTLSLRFRKILTKVTHAQYFQVFLFSVYADRMPHDCSESYTPIIMLLGR